MAPQLYSYIFALGAVIALFNRACEEPSSWAQHLCQMQELRQRIRDSYEARWKAEKHFDEDQILNEMPGSLRIEVRMRNACGI